MKNIAKNIGFALIAATIIASCNPLELDDIQDPNNPSVGSIAKNASPEQIQFLITGLESRHRGYVTNISQAWNTFGREIWYLNASDPRFQTDWLGQNGRVPDRSYFGFGNTGGGSWATPYQAIKQADVLKLAADNTDNITAAQKSAVVGFSKTIQGYQYMIPANFVYNNGIRMDVTNPLKPGPFVPYEEALNQINTILDEGFQALGASGSGNFPFKLTSGFNGFNTITGLQQVNRAIAARLNAYRKDWQGVLTALEGSFMNLNGNLNAGPAHPYGAAPDIFNPLYYVPNAAVNTMIVVHPSVLDDATPGDLRVQNKFLKRTNPVTVTTDAGALVGTHQDARWVSNSSPITYIRNEELILLKAEAHANLNQGTAAVAAINIIRNAAGIGPYTGATTTAALIDEILYQRRYSLWAEPWGHRWIDARRYDRLADIPTSYDKGTIFTQFPHPQAELSWDDYIGN
ncbi:SusD-like starch-binding protein associating with outer membrane [Algoriphagus ratkowskyi]|uniref:RagB/SusD family nutrient uptake outer membrane protein n=1 Tax=Algoriphagus ratkowskyi TaxID=57028 RepID=A0A2W7RC57_9BACT|nr:RagB/SusD family nutrient uptake outer membrane protein [Algoriphagus ratkowskyi]PZX57641.1 SusD-like starch-binding protein associating with outer membrane [Algoriphagus ratkowskyi]TXD78912.1 RagB/SusD family nutrient uptake outer membrane protein [Algoriphagus ratkowskyi]